MANETTRSVPRLADAAVVQMNEVIKHAGKLKDIISASIDAAPALSADTVERSIGEKVGLSFPTVQAIFSAIDNLNMLKADNDSTDAAIDSVVSTFGKERFPDIDAAREAIRNAVDAYTDNNPIAISLKARRLAYLYEKLYIQAEIITDARPVYNVDGDAVLEFVVNHSLVLTYHEDSGYGAPHAHPRIHIAMDLDDIFSLRDVCDRAILKGSTLKSELGKKARVLGDDG